MIEYNFTITTPIEVFESLGPNKVRVGGTFIRLEVPTKNGRIYQVQEAEQIAKDLMGKAVYIHADPTTGLHYNKDDMLVGQIASVIIDKAKKLIRGFIDIWNTPKFPNLISRIKKGWGFSIGGVVQKYLSTGKFNERMMPIVHALGMRANHIQLLEPQEKRGDPAAMVDEVEYIPVMESLQVSPDPFPVVEAEIPITEETKVETVEEKVEETPAQETKEVQETEKKVVITEIHKKDEWIIIIE